MKKILITILALLAMAAAVIGVVNLEKRSISQPTREQGTTR